MVEDETRGGGEKRNGRTRKEGGFPGRNNEPERYYYYVYIYICEFGELGFNVSGQPLFPLSR